MKTVEQKKTYLVTGGAGFIGSNFVHFLFEQRESIQVKVLDKLTYAGNLENLQDFEKKNNFEFIKGDICDKEIVHSAMADVDVVVNFAAESAVDRSINDPEVFLKTDTIGVYTLLEEARRLGTIEKFVQISTDEVYGEIHQGSFSENAELKPRNPYSASKLGGDRLAYSFFATYGLPVIITRASNNFGPRCYPEKVIALFITNIFEDKKVPVYGEGKQIRDWLFVRDHCSAIDTVIRQGKNGEVYNVGGVYECSNIDLTRLLLRLMKKDDSLIEYVKDRPGHDFRYSLNAEKLKSLGWVPKYDLENGLKETIQWYRDNKQWWQPLKKTMESKYIKGYWGGGS